MNKSPRNSSDEKEEVSIHNLFSKHIERRFENSINEEVLSLKPEDKQQAGLGLRLLKIYPWLLGLFFLFSFWWDFDGRLITIGEYALPLEGLLRILAVSGLIGFFTNWVAIIMLFYPRKRRPVLGQGLIPAQKNRIALRLAAAVERELINPELIKQEFIDNGLLQKYTDILIWDIKALTSDKDFRNDITILFEQYIRQGLQDPRVKSNLVQQAEEVIMQSVKDSKVERSALKLYLVMKGKTLKDLLDEAIANLPDRISNAAEPINALIDTIPARMRKDRFRLEQIFVTVLSRIIDQIDIRKIIEENINRYDEEKLERIIKGSTDTHLNYIKYLGAVIGSVGGLVIWNPLASLSLLAAIGSLVWITDRLLHQEN
ncbi:MAG: DUF445 domain-containing protein [Balneolia bacterium]|nr:DUF445 domain-containing protein [Balneolia bacterium]